MEKRKRRVYWIFILVLLAGFAWLVLRPHEPIYQGKPLSHWLNEAHDSRDFEYAFSHPVAEAALRAEGTRVLPLLVKMAGVRRSFWHAVVGDLAEDRHLAFLHLPPQRGKAEIALWGFRLFGPEGKPAVPGLIRLLREGSEWAKMDAAWCLAAIGPAAEEAVPALVETFQAQTNSGYYDEEIQKAVAEALGSLGPGARRAIPALEAATNCVSAELAALRLKGQPLDPVFARLADTSDPNAWRELAYSVGGLGSNVEAAIPYFLDLLTDTNAGVPSGAIRALGQIRKRPDLCIPRLCELLSTNDQNSSEALRTLRNFGPEARAAVPEIVGFAERAGSRWLLAQCTNALRDIDPRALANLKLNEVTRDVSPAR